MPEVNHVSVEDDVLLAFEPQLGVVAAAGDRAAREQVLVAADLRADEAALDVSVDLAGGVLRVGSAGDRPGAVFVLADREERNVPEQVVARADDAIET